MIVGIGGASTSGKSTLADWICEYLSNRKCLVLHQDDHCFPEEKLPRIKDRIDWEVPEAIDFERTISTIKKARRTNDLIIHEGYMAFCSEELNQLYTHSIFLEINNETFLKRKESDKRWGYEPGWYLDHIWNSYLQFGIPPSNLPKLLRINSDKYIDYDAVVNFLR